MKLRCGNRILDLKQPCVMGILNVTPDSFSDGGKYVSVDAAVRRALEMAEEGANIIDVGGESTGPGSQNVPLHEELRRVIPVIQAVSEKFRTRGIEVWISVDTYKAEVARKAIEAGACMVNDVTALRCDSDMVHVVAEKNVPVVLMYSKDTTPRTTRKCVHYKDVVKTILAFLQERVDFVLSHGVRREYIILDPGMGAFVSGDARYSLEILRRLREFQIGFPVLVGASRKSFVGAIMGEVPVDQRLEGSLACVMEALQNGANIFRVHDVKETVDLLKRSA